MLITGNTKAVMVRNIGGLMSAQVEQSQHNMAVRRKPGCGEYHSEGAGWRNPATASFKQNSPGAPG